MSEALLNQIITVQLQGNVLMAQQVRQMGRGFQALGDRVDRMGRSITRSMRQSGRATQRASRQTRSGLTNIQSGLVQLSTWLLNTNVKINNVFSNMKVRFSEAESAMTQLKITMGLSGETALTNAKGMQSFGEAVGQIDLLARTTQFTQKEVANAFTALVQSGRSVEEASKMISSTLQFATASGGLVGLKDSVDLATLTIGTLGGGVTEVDANLNMLLRTAQKTKIGFTDLRQVLQSMRAAFSRFKEEGGISREAELMALAASAKSLGLSAGNSGEKVDQFSSALLGMVSAAEKSSLMLNRVGASGRKSVRFSAKREQLVRFFGADLLSTGELQRQLKTQESNIRLLQDEFVKRQILNFNQSSQKYEKRGMSDLISVFVRNFTRLSKTQGIGEGMAEVITAKAFGTKAASTMLKAIIALAQNAGVPIDQAGEHFRSLVKVLQKNLHDLLKADEEAKKTLAYRTKVLDSAIEALSNTVFKHDIVAISALDTYKETISATNELMRSNKSLAATVSFLGRGLQLLTGVGTTVGFTLVAAATFSTALTFAVTNTAGAVVGLSGTLGAFARIFLLPTLTVVGQLTLGLGALGLGVVALMRYLSEGKSIGEGFKILLDNIKYAAMGAGGMINLVFNKKYSNQNVKTLVKDYYKTSDALADIEKQMDQLKARGGDLEFSNLKGLEKQYDSLGAKLSSIKGVLGESGYVGLDALGVRGKKGIATGIASTIEIVKQLFRGLAIIGEGALVPILASMEAILYGLQAAFIVVTFPIRVLAGALGYTLDAIDGTKFALTALGYALGAIIAFKGLFFVWGMLRRSLDMVTSGFARVGTGINNYITTTSTRLGTANRASQASLNRNSSAIQRLELAYFAVTGSANQFTSALRRTSNGASLTSQHFNTQAQRLTTLRNRLNSTRGALIGLGGAAATVGGLMSTSQDESTAKLGQQLMMWGTLSTLLITFATTVAPLVGAAFTFLAAGALGAFGAVLLIAGAIAGVTYLLMKLIKYSTSSSESTHEDPYKDSKASPAGIRTTSVGDMRKEADVYYDLHTPKLNPNVTSNVPSLVPAGQAQRLGGNVPHHDYSVRPFEYLPTQTNVINESYTQSSATSGRSVTITNPDQTIINIDTLELKTSGSPEQLKKTLRDIGTVRKHKVTPSMSQ